MNTLAIDRDRLRSRGQAARRAVVAFTKSAATLFSLVCTAGIGAGLGGLGWVLGQRTDAELVQTALARGITPALAVDRGAALVCFAMGVFLLIAGICAIGELWKPSKPKVE
jgi:hypothetical protein